MNLPVPIAEDMLPADWPAVLAMAPELAKAFAARQLFRTETEARISVLDDVHFPTRAAKYHQCIREQCVMADQAALLSIDWRRNWIKRRHLTAILTIIEGGMPPNMVDLEGRLAEKVAADLKTLGVDVHSSWYCIEALRDATQVDLDEALFANANMLAVAKDRVRELMMWSKIKAELDDGSFDTENVDTHQLVSYTTQFCLRAAHADQGKMTAGEMDNLSGQLRASLARAKATGVLDEVKRNLPPKVAQELLLMETDLA